MKFLTNTDFGKEFEFDVSWLYMFGLPTWLFSVLLRNHVVNTNVNYIKSTIPLFSINITSIMRIDKACPSYGGMKFKSTRDGL